MYVQLHLMVNYDSMINYELYRNFAAETLVTEEYFQVNLGVGIR